MEVVDVELFLLRERYQNPSYEVCICCYDEDLNVEYQTEGADVIMNLIYFFRV